MLSFFQGNQRVAPRCMWEGELQVRKRLGEGAFGDVLLVRDSNQQSFAVKIAPGDSTAAKLLQNEYKTYKHLGCVGTKKKGLTQVHVFGYDPNHDDDVLVMNRLGASLRDVMKMNGDSLPTFSVLRIGSQVIRRLQYIHGCGVVHGDIKPRNILCGWQSFDKIYIVDFGLATVFREGRGNRLKEMTTGRQFQGTEDFASRHTHRGIALSRRDDLESLGFTLVYLMKGLLPWTRNREDEDMTFEDTMQPPEPNDHIDILAQKEGILIEDLCEGLPPSIEFFMRYVCDMEFYDDPDYSFLIDLFENGMKELKESGDADNGEELDIWPDLDDKRMFIGHREEDELWERHLRYIEKKKQAEQKNGHSAQGESEAVIEPKEEKDDQQEIQQPEQDVMKYIASQLVSAFKTWSPLFSSRVAEERSVASEAQKSPVIGLGRDRTSLFGKLRRWLRPDVSEFRTILLKHEEDSWTDLSCEYEYLQ